MSVHPSIILALWMLPIAGLAQAASEQPGKPIHITGRLVSADGKPVVLWDVRMSRVESIGSSTNTTSTQTDSDGVFSFLAVPGPEYRLDFGSGVKTPPKQVDTGSGQDVSLGDTLYERCPAPTGTSYGKRLASPPALVGNLKLAQITVDPAWAKVKQFVQLSPQFSPADNRRGIDGPSEDFPPCWEGPSLAKRDEWENLCGKDLTFPNYISVEAFVGGRVKSVRVVAYDQALTPAQVKEEFRKVWLGVFRSPSCFIPWDEGGSWNLRAVVEFEDGKRTSLLTDGGHVEVQDREGNYWYLREWPAVG